LRPFELPNWLGYTDSGAKDWSTDGDGVYPQHHTTMTTLTVWAGGLQRSSQFSSPVQFCFCLTNRYFVQIRQRFAVRKDVRGSSTLIGVNERLPSCAAAGIGVRAHCRNWTDCSPVHNTAQAGLHSYSYRSSISSRNAGLPSTLDGMTQYSILRSDIPLFLTFAGRRGRSRAAPCHSGGDARQPVTAGGSIVEPGNAMR
jgi:hypothetical protein